ncbi:spore germination protein [Salinibacillus kushneri]|uniref:Spore germination protein n=1 Tax=Salinibacillus kushneri TaxID=237682 RepID=A0A1I0IQC1_9BACI|nr:Ger(x)C family spore germination protein [Salinibacillus kushneri]SET99107.1 spore germination protein [Salinibacillus kushneri]
MKTATIAVMLSIVVFLGTGCGVEREIVDDLSLVTAVGYDAVEGNKVKGTIAVPNFQADKAVTTEIFSDTSMLLRENNFKLNAEANRPLAVGKLEVILFNEELARKGLQKLKDVFVRDPSLGSRVRLGIVEGSTTEVLTREYWDDDSGMYLSDMFEQNIDRGTIPETNLHLFTYNLYSKGADPFLPFLSVTDMVKIDGIALFDDERYVGRLPYEQTFTFNSLIGDFQNAIFPVYRGDKKSASVSNIRSDRKIQYNGKGNHTELVINVHIKGIIREYRGGKITKKVIKKIENTMEKQMKQQAEDILNKLQELNIDPLGLGNEYHSEHRNFNWKKWEDMYPNIKITPKIDVKIMEYGIRR